MGQRTSHGGQQVESNDWITTPESGYIEVLLQRGEFDGVELFKSGPFGALP
jgi:hypothetical protein